MLVSALTRSALLGLVLTPEAKSCSFWRTSLGKFRLLRPSGQREVGGGFLEEDTEEVLTDPCSSGCTCCVPLDSGTFTSHPPPQGVLQALDPSPEQGGAWWRLGPHSTLSSGFPAPLTDQWP